MIGLGLTSIPAEISNLSKLVELRLSQNKFSEFPAVVLNLSKLKILTIYGNELEFLPPEIRRLRQLIKLGLSKNRIAVLPTEFCELSFLRAVELGRNNLKNLPSAISEMPSVKRIDLRGNQLSALPESFESVRFQERLTELALHENPALGLPDSILGDVLAFNRVGRPKNGRIARPADILNFYFEQKRSAAAGTLKSLNEIKVMLVGRGGAGKTSLRRFFMGRSHNRREKETPGIALDSFELLCGDEKVKVRLWDFAGQEITHALHQFFLTEGCVYILVLDPRSNTEARDAEYWLGLLQRYSRGAPVIVALNRQDARMGGYDVDRHALHERFPSIRAFVLTNCEKRTGCVALRKALVAAIAHLGSNEMPKLRVPETWLNVKEHCFAARGEKKGISRQHLTLDEFRDLCRNHGEHDALKQESLARLLHKLGAVLHFVDEPRLRDTTVLNPHWVTDGVYKLLRFKDGPHSDGLVTLLDAMKALPKETEATVRFLLTLMERFEMCFSIDEDGGKGVAKKWLLPGALTEFQPAGLSDEWQNNERVKLRYVYDPLPEGVIPRFIVTTHPLSEGQIRWRHGVILQDGGARALIRRGGKANTVEVTAVGPIPERLRLLEIIQGNLERIHTDLPDPKPIAEVELAGLPDVFRRIDDLEAAEDAKQQVAIKTEDGDRLVNPVDELNRSSEPEARDESRTPLHAFLSYAHEDKSAKKVFDLNLTVMMKKKFITHWHDGLIEPGMRWKEEILENLGKMDVFVGLLTTAFLASDFIEKVELKAARDELKTHGKNFLFVLIMVEDVSLKNLDLAQYQILKPGGKAVSQHKNRKEGFNIAQKELEVILGKLQVRRTTAQKELGGPAGESNVVCAES